MFSSGILLFTFLLSIDITYGNSYSNNLDGGFKFASYYGDHMVLQKAPKRAILWGYAPIHSIGETIMVTVGSDVVGHGIVQSRQNSAIWRVSLDPISKPGPFTIRVKTPSHLISLEDVLFGDVYICSGQSNMMFEMTKIFNSSAELGVLGNYPHIRVFTVGLNYSSTPLQDLISIQEPWSVPSKESIGQPLYFSAVCWLYAKYLYEHLGYPLGLIASDWGGTPIEAWSSKDALSQCGVKDCSTSTFMDSVYPLKRQKDHSQLWNAMIHPFINMTIFGALWYQGEANRLAPNTYNCTFPAMISDWRKQFHIGSQGQTDPTFPFGFVQLSAFRKDPHVVGGFPVIRWHQTADFGFVPNYRMPNTFMAVAMDLPDFKSPWTGIHPRDKEDVARRLVLGGLAQAYKIPGIRFQGPQITAFYIDIGFSTLGLEYDNATSAIEVRNKNGFEVCCSNNNQSYCSESDSRWTPAPIIKSDNSRVTLSYKACANQWIVGLRYAWRESPCPFKQCAVYSQINELPAPPFVVNGLIGLDIKFWCDILASVGIEL